jgi:hypothetical protein
MKGQHVNSRKLAGASAASVGAATAVAALLLGALSGTAGEEPTAKAYGLAVDGLITIPPTPYVEAPPDGHKALLEIPGPKKDANGLYIGLLKVEAEHFRSRATAVDVRILNLLKLKLLEATCENGHGESALIRTDGGDKESPYKGQELDLSPVIKVEFNHQYRDRDKLTVEAAVISVLPNDHHGRAISDKDLNLLRSLAGNQLKVPTMEQVQAAHAKSKAPAGAPLTVGDLVGAVKELNPALATPKGDRDALLEIVISSASCREEHREARHEQKQEAPPPKPVEAHLPVTH